MFFNKNQKQIKLISNFPKNYSCQKDRYRDKILAILNKGVPKTSFDGMSVKFHKITFREKFDAMIGVTPKFCKNVLHPKFPLLNTISKRKILNHSSYLLPGILQSKINCDSEMIQLKKELACLKQNIRDNFRQKVLKSSDFPIKLSDKYEQLDTEDMELDVNLLSVSNYKKNSDTLLNSRNALKKNHNKTMSNFKNNKKNWDFITPTHCSCLSVRDGYAIHDVNFSNQSHINQSNINYYENILNTNNRKRKKDLTFLNKIKKDVFSLKFNQYLKQYK